MWCDHHHVDTHNTEDCHAKAFHKSNSGFKSNKGKNNYRGKSNGKPWAKAADSEKKYTKAEVNALIQKGFKQLKTQMKKRKDNDDGSVNVLEIFLEDPDKNNNTVKDVDTNRQDIPMEISDANTGAKSDPEEIEIFSDDDTEMVDTLKEVYGSEIVKKWVNGKKSPKSGKMKTNKSNIADAGSLSDGSKLVSESRSDPDKKKIKKIKKVKKSGKIVSAPKIKVTDTSTNPNGKKIENMTEAELTPTPMDLDDVDEQLLDYRDNTDKFSDI